MIVKEINIAVPWGHVTAKTWGCACNSKILMVHGIFDNAESFSKLIQLLPQSFYYVVVDLPGHGKSSHFPKNIIVNYWDYILTIRLVVQFLNETPIILLGHSFGGSLLTVYTQLYPNEVSKLILIDSIYLLYNFEVEIFKNYMERYIRQACDMLTQIATYPTFTYDDGLDLFTTKRLFGSISSESAAHIYERNIVSLSEGKYQNAADPRIKFSRYIFMDTLTSKRIFKKHSIPCPTLNIISNGSKIPAANKKLMIAFGEITKSCLTRYVHGNHHVHINSPETVAPLINDFLKPKSNL